jgi:hypothetical protein
MELQQVPSIVFHNHFNTSSMKLSQQESKFLAFLTPKSEVYWQELAQFCKDPASVKLKTVKKVVSDLKKKFTDEKLPVPFNCAFKDLSGKNLPKMIATNATVDFNGQKLVQVARVQKNQNEGQFVSQGEISRHFPVVKATNPKPNAPEFTINPHTRHIRTKSGNYNLNYDEFDVFGYLYNNRYRFISLEELRDNVCFPKFGSKLPARWFSAIQRRICNIRHQIPETRDKLLTAKQQTSTGYIFN